MESQKVDLIEWFDNVFYLLCDFIHISWLIQVSSIFEDTQSFFQVKFDTPQASPPLMGSQLQDLKVKRSSPPPTFKFLRDAEEKLLRLKELEGKKEVTSGANTDEIDGSFVNLDGFKSKNDGIQQNHQISAALKDETGAQSSEATNRPALPDLNEEVAGQTSYWQFDLNHEPCDDEDVNRECYGGEQSQPPQVAVKKEEADIVYQNMDWNTNEPHVDDLDVEHFDELMDHPWLAFPQGTSVRRRRDRLLKKEMGNQKAIDYDLLAELGQQERMTAIIGEDTTWSRLFEMTYAPQYRLITVDFLSTFRYRPQPPDFQPQPGQAQPAEVSFRLCGAAYHLSSAEFGSVLGLYTEEETHMPIYTTAIHTADGAVVSAWWPRIGDDAFDRSARVTRIHDSLIRYLHRCIASSNTGRGMSQEWCTSQDLFFLYCILSGRPCNLARCLAEYFSTYYHR
ncbi:hypothetical protein R6Q59_012313 [Mikania micrantha]